MAGVGPSGVMVTVNNGEPIPGYLIIDQGYETVWSATATKPDPDWTFIDDAGHFHAYAADGKLPTLRGEQRHVSCDGSCGGLCDDEGYSETEWHCLICGVPVIPRRVPDSQSRRIPTLTTWTVELRTERPIECGPVTVRIQDARGDVRFGVASAHMASIVIDERTTVTTQLLGMGQLALRMAP